MGELLDVCPKKIRLKRSIGDTGLLGQVACVRLAEGILIDRYIEIREGISMMNR